MGIIAEDFRRCECGNAEFEQKTIVTLTKPNRVGSIEPIETRHIYVCTNPECNKTITP